MFFQVGFLLEAAATLLAFEGSLPSVGPQVHLQVGLSLLGKLFATNRARQDLLYIDIAILGPESSRGQQHGRCGVGQDTVTLGAHQGGISFLQLG